MTYEFNTTFKIKEILKNGKQTLDVQYKLLVSKGNTNYWSFEIIKLLPNKTEKQTNTNYFSITSFSGTLYHYNLKGENTKIKAFKNGKLLNVFSDKEKGTISRTSKVPPIGEDTNGFWLYTRTQHYTDWYRSNGSGGWTYTHSVLNYTTSEYVWVSTGGSTNAEYHGHSPSGTFSPTDNHPVEVIVNLTGKALCVYNKLNSLSSGFANAIKKFDGEFPVSHLKLTINNGLISNVYGETQPPVGFVTEIQFNENSFASLSDLGIATVFAHEIIHAEIFRKMLSAAKLGSLEDVNNMNAQQQTNYVNSLKNNFPGLYDYYYRRYKPTWNHEMMANHYRSTIADIIQQFDNNRLPRSTYEDITWVGLGKLDTNITTIAWDNLSPEAKARINRLISENFYNGPKNCN